MKTKLHESCCYGVYHRTGAGVWLYPWGDEVPGAHDVTFGDMRRLGLCLSPCESADQPAGELSPIDLGLSDSGFAAADGGGDPDDRVIGMAAPELQVRAMLTMTDIADVLRVATDTVAAYRHRGYLPEPQATVGRVPVWARPIIRHWSQARPGSGWRSDIYGDRQEYDEYVKHQRAARRLQVDHAQAR